MIRHNNTEGLTTLWVRSWDGVPSMPEGLAVMRAIERRYGKLKYFQFFRVRRISVFAMLSTNSSLQQDQELSDMYQSWFIAEFENRRDLEHISLERQVIQLEVPIIERKLMDGIGLEDIHTLLHPKEKGAEAAPISSIVERVATGMSEQADASEAPKPTTRIIDVEIQRTGECHSVARLRMIDTVPSTET